jgi:hypothetical protein
MTAGRALRADCARCLALCCVAPAFQRSADFAIDKPPGVACPNLRDDDRCGIHADLRERGFAGCAAYDCFGAGQRVSAGAARDAELFARFAVVRQLHELLWYLDEALELEPSDDLQQCRVRIDGLAAEPLQADPVAERDVVAPLLRRAAAPSGTSLRGADRVGADLRGADLRGADLSGALLLGTDLRDADLREAMVLGADLRGARLDGADLSTAIYLTQNQAGGTQGDAATRIPARIDRPAHWGA